MSKQECIEKMAKAIYETRLAKDYIVGDELHKDDCRAASENVYDIAWAHFKERMLSAEVVSDISVVRGETRAGTIRAALEKAGA